MYNGMDFIYTLVAKSRMSRWSAVRM